MLRCLVVFGFIHVVLAASVDKDAASRVRRQTSSYSTVMEQFINGHNYAVERHNVTTSDGYILGLFRMPFAQHQTAADADRPVVFLMHGLYGQSINFVAAGPEYAPGFNLADAGFDVWLGNARGNIHSRAHINLDPDDLADKAQFFDFTWEEIGMLDVPAMIDYVLEYTGKDKLHYIGHSQGGTVFLVMASMVPEYNEKMASVHLLAGVGYQNYFPNEELKFLASMTNEIYTLLQDEGLFEVSVDLINEIGLLPAQAQGYSRADLCFGDIKYKNFCSLIGAKHYMRATKNTELEEMDNFGGGSTKQVAHYGQNIQDTLFRRFVYSETINLQLYNSSTPPVYDLGLITSDVVMHYSLNDDLLDERDVLAMAADMPNTRVRKVARDSFEHGDFAGAPDAKELVTDWIIQSINNVHNGVDSGDGATGEGDEDDDTDDQVTAAPVEATTPQDSAAGHITLTFVGKLYLLFCTTYFLLH